MNYRQVVYIFHIFQQTEWYYFMTQLFADLPCLQYHTKSFNLQYNVLRLTLYISQSGTMFLLVFIFLFKITQLYVSISINPNQFITKLNVCYCATYIDGALTH